MAHNRDELDEELAGSHNPYASSTRWRHEESSAFRRHAGSQMAARDAEVRGQTNDLAKFLNSTRVNPEDNPAGPREPGASKSKPIVIDEAHAAAVGEPEPENVDPSQAVPQDGKTIACGPLLNYKHMDGNLWHGSVLVVTKGGGKEPTPAPTLVLRRVGSATGSDSGPVPSATGNGETSVEGVTKASGGTEVQGICLYSDARNTFWRFNLDVEMEQTETKWEYALPDMRFISKTKPRVNAFFVPAVTESMRIMFHSCNGFSVGTDEEAWSGAALWNDVMRRHKEAPFHVMIGGGDQIYNDGIRVNGPLREWTNIGNPKKRREFPFPEKLRSECDDYYLRNYLRWYSVEPFAAANGQIPQVNIWDDHDIIDGFGSYVNEFMKCDVFRGIGGTAHKYYMLFQHHLPPPLSTYTSDAPQTVTEPGEQGGVDHNQLVSTFVGEAIREPCYIIGNKPGPYVAEHSHNIFARLGARIALIGIDARVERTRHQVNYPETYDLVFGRLKEELTAAASSGKPFKHVILLLGIPIAYPRLTWLENIFSSPLMGPIKFANRRFGLGGGIFNHFDGSVDLLDDLDDHYTARTHKKERNTMVERLQTICAEHSVRITILGGDVHLAALGRFYSNPSLNIPTENDHRYMANVVSSAIVNKPPPQAIANLLARRNKIHHLNHETDETLLSLFNKDPGNSSKTAGHNQVTMPSRNFAMITENSPNNSGRDEAIAAAHPTTNGNHLAPPDTAPPGSSHSNGARSQKSSKSSKSNGKGGHGPLHVGEVDAGTTHRAASPTLHGKGNDGSIDICIRVEIDQHDKNGLTENYGLTVPTLHYTSPTPPATSLRS